jgi:hypothetical protein
MIRFSASGCAIVDVDSYQSKAQMLRTIEMFEEERPDQKNVEFVIDVGYPIVNVSEDSFYYNGGKARTYEIEDIKWAHLNQIATQAYVTIKQGGWYFTIARNNIGFWYSADMLALGWWHGETKLELDHHDMMYTRRDYAS